MGITVIEQGSKKKTPPRPKRNSQTKGLATVEVNPPPPPRVEPGNGPQCGGVISMRGEREALEEEPGLKKACVEASIHRGAAYAAVEAVDAFIRHTGRMLPPDRRGEIQKGVEQVIRRAMGLPLKKGGTNGGGNHS